MRRVAVVLPPPESPLLTRELLYTAVTRAREHVRILGTPESVRAAVERPRRPGERPLGAVHSDAARDVPLAGVGPLVLRRDGELRTRPCARRCAST